MQKPQMANEQRPRRRLYFLDKSKGINYFKKFDYTVLVCVLALSAFGLVVVESATRTMSGNSRIMLMQAVSVIIGAVVAIVLSIIDYRVFRPTGIFLYAVSVLLLGIVLFKGTGREVGSRSWLILPGGISFQPAEFAKITFVIMVAKYLEMMGEGRGRYNLLKLVAVSVIPIVLVLQQPDYGTAVVFFVILGAMLYIWGIKYRYIIMAAGAALAAFPVMWLFFFNDARKARILEFLSPGHDPSGASYQVMKAKMAIGSGRWFGWGLGNGLQTQNPVESIPIKESDCIFAVIGEELGFLGASLVIVLFVIILLRCLYVAGKPGDYFGEYLVIGITGMFAFHFFENVGMNLGIMPLTGIPLPFISQGGSAMVTNYFAIGIVLSVSLRKKKTTMFNSEQ